MFGSKYAILRMRKTEKVHSLNPTHLFQKSTGLRRCFFRGENYGI